MVFGDVNYEMAFDYNTFILQQVQQIKTEEENTHNIQQQNQT